MDKVLIDLEIESKIAFLNEESDKGYLHTLTKETQNRLSILSPDAVYIFNGRPLILFYDLDKNPKNKIDLHKKIWSFDDAPIVFIIEKSDVEVFNALNYVKNEGEQGLELLEITFEEVKKRFNIWELESGQTWEWLQGKYLRNRNKQRTKRVNERLFANIKSVRNHLIEKESLSNHQANSLILRLIFIRYLIDRKVRIDKDLLPGNPEEVNQRRKALIELIKQPERLNELFVKLNEKFNGVLFKELDTVFTYEQANYLANVFGGELLGDDSLFEGFFFEIFDFSVIPVELISGIYESLIDEEQRNEDSAIYTPSFLVDYILKDTVDEFLKSHKPEECTVFEVAVGSGIFLVQSLRRMIEREIELNGSANKEAFGEKIKTLAENNLYGVDINPEALKVTCFSIYIALLDYLEPADINVYKFPELIGKSLFLDDFFGKIENDKLLPADFEKVIHKVKPKFILGNPPWKKDKSPTHLKWVNSRNIYGRKINGKTEISQSFLLRTKEFMSEETICSLVVTSTMFFNVYGTTKVFKDKFLRSFNLEKVTDLSPIRRLIFKGKTSPATIVKYSLPKHKSTDSNIVTYHSVKSNVYQKNLKGLFIEKFDQKEIPQKYFLQFDWMFKMALYGNMLDFELIKRITKADDLSLDRKLKDKLLFGGSGILKGTPKKHFSFLEGLPLNENNNIKELYTPNSSYLMKKEDTYLEAGRQPEWFKNDKILFKEQALEESSIVISYNEGNSVYKKGVFAINTKDKTYLKYLFSILTSKLYEYYIFSISGSWGTSTRPQIRWKEEFLSFPIYEAEENLREELIYLVNAIIESIKHYKNRLSPFKLDPFGLTEVQLGLIQINKIVNSIYDLKNYEEDLIDYTLEVSRYQFQESKQNKFLKKVHEDKGFLSKYANVFLSEISTLYPDEYLQVEIYTLSHFIAMSFVFSNEAPKEKIIYSKNKNVEAVLQKLADNLSVQKIINTSDPEKSLFIQRDVKGFEKDSFYIIKPNELKSWHRARAWYDLAEIKEALQVAEINLLNDSAK